MNKTSRVALSLTALVFALAIGACSEKLDRSNPFDPKAPKALQAKASLKGAVTLEGGLEPAAGTSILLSGDEGSFDTITDDDGRFTVSGIISGSYDLLINRKGYEQLKSAGLQFALAEDKDIGEQKLLVLRGSAIGTASLEDTNDFSGISVSMFRSSGGGTQSLSPLASTGSGGTITSYITLSNADGSYTFSGLPDGEYTLVAMKVDYTPAYLMSIKVVGGSVVEIEKIKLYPVTAVIKINDAAKYTNSRNVLLNLFAFNAVEMRVSEDSAFTGITYETFTASKQFLLGATDGEKTVWAQFKDRYGIVSDKYSAKIILNTAPPYSSRGHNKLGE